MDLSRFLSRLVAPTAIGEELLPGCRLEGVSTELGLRLTFRCEEQRVHVEVWPIEGDSRFAARSARLGFSYRRSAASPVDDELGLEVCRAVAERAAQHEEGLLAELREDSAESVEENGRVRRVRVTELLERAGPPEQPYYTLSTYIGCVIGCRFCYAQSRLSPIRRWLGLPDVPWGSWVDVRVNADEILAAELDSLQPLPIKLCPIVSDPYQALESRERVTQRCLEVIATRSGWSPLVLTRSTLVRRDTELLRAIPGARVGFSLPTADDAVRAHFEPRGASIAERLSTLRFLSDAGVQTFAVVQPMLEGSVDELVDALVNTVTSVSIDVLRGVQGAALDFDDDRFRHTAADAWQATRAYELRERLEARGVGVWFGELPPDLSGAH